MQRLNNLIAEYRRLPNILLDKVQSKNPDKLAALYLIKNERDTSWLKATASVTFHDNQA